MSMYTWYVYATTHQPVLFFVACFESDSEMISGLRVSELWPSVTDIAFSGGLKSSKFSHRAFLSQSTGRPIGRWRNHRWDSELASKTGSTTEHLLKPWATYLLNMVSGQQTCSLPTNSGINMLLTAQVLRNYPLPRQTELNSEASLQFGGHPR